jgi:hypothetical protein
MLVSACHLCLLCCVLHVVLQGEVEGLHGSLLQEKRAMVALREELALMATSRDTWRVSRGSGVGG